MFLTFFVLTNKLAAQQYDTIIYVNGTRQVVKITEVSISYVKYKDLTDTLGPTLSLPTQLVQRIVFRKGYMEAPKETVKHVEVKSIIKDSVKPNIKTEEYKRTIIEIDIGQVFIEHLQFNVDYMFKNRNFGLMGYYNLGLLDGFDTAVYSRLETKLNNGLFYKKSYGGLDFKYYLTPNRRTNFWITIGAEGGKVVEKLVYTPTAQTPIIGGQYFQFVNGTYILHQNTTYVTYNSGSSIISLVNKSSIGYHFSSGFLYRINRHFVCQGSLSLGFNQFMAVEGNKFSTKASAGLLFGYAF